MTEWQLRLLILVVGLAVIGLLYALSARRRRRREPPPAPDADEQALRDDISAGLGDGGDDIVVSEAEETTPAPPPKPVPRPTGEPVLRPPLDLTGDDDGFIDDGPGAPPRAPAAGPAAVSGSDEAPPGADTPVPEPRRAPGTVTSSVLPIAESRPRPPLPETPLEAAADGPADDATPGMNVVLLVRAPQGQPFKGFRLMTVLQAQDFTLNEKNLWDYCPYEMEHPLFSIGQLKEPGTFDIATMRELETPGLVLFMRLPRAGQNSAARAVARMLDAAARLAEQLGGELCDEEGRELSVDRQNAMRAAAAAMDRRLAGTPDVGRLR